MKKRVYMDYASATPVDPKVEKVMKPYLAELFANPSGIHREGVIARKAVEGARARVAKIISATPREIVFTAGATESINLALWGAAKAWQKAYPNKTPEIIISGVEHPAVIDTAMALKKEGVVIKTVNPNKDGIILPVDIKKLLSEKTALVSVMYANNETGGVMPIKEIGRVIRLWKQAKGRSEEDFPLFHTDATQAANYLPLHTRSLSVSLMTLNGGKIYGPKSTGIIFVKNKTPIEPMFFGGGQEKGLRPGTENVSGIIGFTEALTIAQDICEKEVERLSVLRDYFIKKLRALPKVVINSSLSKNLPNIINISILGVDAEFLVIELDQAGVAVSARSACKTGETGGSHVILAITRSMERATSSIRFSMGRGTQKTDIDFAVKSLEEILSRKK